MAAAAPLGATRVEAASAGPQKRLRDGSVMAPVEMRILYSRLFEYEVRQATLTCKIDPRGKIVDASP